jgi:hypothetical protein
MATISRPPAVSDPFETHMYVGDLAAPHDAMITLRCMRLQTGGHSGPLVTAFTGKLPIKYVRQKKTMSLTSPALAPDATGSQTVIFTRTAGTQHSLKEAEFEAHVMTADVPGGTYPVTVACGTGTVGVGQVLVS